MGMLYISEENAAERLSKLTKRNISEKDMYELAHLGVVPAYLKFNPSDKEMYPGRAFHLVANAVVNKLKQCDLTTFEGGEFEWSEILPFPLPKNGIINTSIDVPFNVFVARSDAHLESVSEDHYIRVYAPPEIIQAAKNLRLYMSGRSFEPILHNYCETWEIERDQDHDLRIACIISPFSDNERITNATATATKQASSLKDNRERTSLHLMIAALASQAGYDLEDSAEASSKLRSALDAIGLWRSLTGKGPVQKHFEAVKQTVKRERGISDDLLNRK